MARWAGPPQAWPFAPRGEKKIDFIYSNPAAYACMMVEFSIITVASMINLRKGYALERFAGVRPRLSPSEEGGAAGGSSSGAAPWVQTLGGTDIKIRKSKTRRGPSETPCLGCKP